MSHGFFTTIFYQPLYNALIFLVQIIPGHSAGLAVILLTIIIRLILFPLSRQAIKTQLLMKRVDPQIQELKEKVKDKQEQAQALMKLYKDNGINPFASFLLLLIQFPILIAVYQVFRSGLPKVDMTLIYSFVHATSPVIMTLVGINLLNRSIILAIIAVLTQFIQINLSLPPAKPKDPTKAKSFQDDLAQSMNTQMRYILPLIMFPIAYVSAVVGLYLVTTNTFTILQELFVKRRLEKQYAISPSGTTKA